MRGCSGFSSGAVVVVVLGFVVVMMAIVYSLDLLFTWVVNVVFGVPR